MSQLKNCFIQSHTVSDRTRLWFFIWACLAHSQRRRVGHSTVRNGRASILGLQEVEVISHSCRVDHVAWIHSEAVLVSWPWQLLESKTKLISIQSR